MAVKSLWDTGADVTLIEGGLANQLMIQGAGQEVLRNPVKFRGIGSGEPVSKRMLVTDLVFSDGKPRTLKAYIVPTCPHERNRLTLVS